MLKVLVYENNRGESASVTETGYVDFNDYDKVFKSEAEAVKWLEANGFEFVGVDDIDF